MTPNLAGLGLMALLALSSSGSAQTPPERYRADLDPKGFKGTPFRGGPLTGWMLYVYVEGKRVVCVNPYVWTGPNVITCSGAAAIDNEKPREAPRATSDEPVAQAPTGPYAIFPRYPSEIVEDEVELWTKRLTFKTRNEPRRARR